MLDHQKLHASVCLLNDLFRTPFARLPDSWIHQLGHGPHGWGWMEVINLMFREQEARAFVSKTTTAYPPIIAEVEWNLRDIVRKASYKSLKSEASSRRQSQGECSPGRQSLDHQSPKDFASRRGGGVSAQSEVVQHTSPGEGVFTERVPSPPLWLSSPVSSPVSLPVPLPTPLPIPPPVASSVASLVASPVASPIPLLVAAQVSLSNEILVDSGSEFTLLAGTIEWDLLDHNAIHALIDGVLRGTNVKEFLERLEVLAYSGRHSFIAVDFFLYKIFQTLARR